MNIFFVQHSSLSEFGVNFVYICVLKSRAFAACWVFTIKLESNSKEVLFADTLGLTYTWMVWGKRLNYDCYCYFYIMNNINYSTMRSSREPLRWVPLGGSFHKLVLLVSGTNLHMTFGLVRVVGMWWGLHLPLEYISGYGIVFQFLISWAIRENDFFFFSENELI